MHSIQLEAGVYLSWLQYHYHFNRLRLNAKTHDQNCQKNNFFYSCDHNLFLIFLSSNLIRESIEFYALISNCNPILYMLAEITSS